MCVHVLRVGAAEFKQEKSQVRFFNVYLLEDQF